MFREKIALKVVSYCQNRKIPILKRHLTFYSYVVDFIYGVHVIVQWYSEYKSVSRHDITFNY